MSKVELPMYHVRIDIVNARGNLYIMDEDKNVTIYPFPVPAEHAFGLHKFFAPRTPPQVVQSDEECAREIADVEQDAPDYEDLVELMTPIIAAHRTAAEKKARAEAWEDGYKAGLHAVYEEAEGDVSYGTITKLQDAIPNPYKEEK